MIINEHTLTKVVLPYLTDDDIIRLMDEADEVPLEKSVYSMTIAEYFEACEDDYLYKLLDETYLLTAIGKLKRYKSEMEAVNKFLDANKIPESAEVKQAQMGVQFPDWQSAILLEIAQFLHLHSLEDAGSVHVSEWMIIHRHVTAQSRLEYNLNKIYEQKNKTKNKR